MEQTILLRGMEIYIYKVLIFFVFLIFVHRLAFISTALLVFPLDRCDVHLSLPFYLIVLALLSTSECRPSDTPLADVIYIVSFEQKKNASQTLSEPYALMDKDTCRSRYRRRTMLNAMCSMQHACVCAYVAMMRWCDARQIDYSLVVPRADAF